MNRFPRIGWVGVGLVGTFAVAALAAPALSGYRPGALSGRPVEPPSLGHLLGTNQLGQDLASQMLFGARTSLVVAAVTAAGTLLLGASVGLAAGWSRGWGDTVLMRGVDVVLALPRLPVFILIGVYAGRDLMVVALAMAAVFWPPTARIVRAEVRSLRERAHVRAATSFGAGPVEVIMRHVLPQIGLVLAAAMVIAAGRAVMFEAGLAFLGLGDPSRTSWGSIMRDARLSPGLFYTRIWTWWMLPPVAAVVLVLLGLTLVGVALEEQISPRLARHARGGGRP